MPDKDKLIAEVARLSQSTEKETADEAKRIAEEKKKSEEEVLALEVFNLLKL